MQITELRIRKVEGEGKLRAYVTVTFDNCFVVHNVKIIEGKNGLFIAMPSRKTVSPLGYSACPSSPKAPSPSPQPIRSASSLP